MPKDLMQMVNDGIVLGDGGMFLEANWRGYDVPEIIGTDPQALQQIHRDFYNAGAQVLQALTWFTSSAELEARYGWQDRVEEINRTAIQAAKEAANEETPVGCCLVSTKTGSRAGEEIFDPDNPTSRARAQAEWEEQIAILVAAGADFLIPETFFRLDEVRVCLESCKKTDLPTMVLLGIGSEKTTQDGATAAESARILADEGADIVGYRLHRRPRADAADRAGDSRGGGDPHSLPAQRLYPARRHRGHRLRRLPLYGLGAPGRDGGIRAARQGRRDKLYRRLLRHRAIAHPGDGRSTQSRRLK